MSAVLFFIGAIGAITGAIGVVTVRNPFYSVLSLVVHLISLAVLFLLLRAEFVAAAQVVVYAGAVMVLYVFVVAYVGGGEQMLGGAVLRVLGPLFALALAIELCIATLGSALKGVSGKGGPVCGGVRHSRPHREPVPDQVPVPVRSCLDPAAGGGRRRGRARPSPPRPRGARRGARAAAPRATPRLHGHDGRGRRDADHRDRARAGARRRGRHSRGRLVSGHRLVPLRLGDHLLHRSGGRAHAPQPARDPAVPRADAQRRQPRAGRVLAHVGRRGRSGVRADRDGCGGL